MSKTPEQETAEIAAKLERLKSRMPANVRAAHVRCSHNRDEILVSEICACFYCRASFAPAEIVDWIDHERTARCPRCGIDSVLGSAAGFPLTKEFLDEMHRYWF